MTTTVEKVTTLFARYLRRQGINIRTEVSILPAGTRTRPDLRLTADDTFFGAATWEDTKWNGYSSMQEYLRLPDVSGAFLIAYPNTLKQVQLSADEANPATALLTGHNCSVVTLRSDAAPSIATLPVADLPAWLRTTLASETEPQVDPTQVVDLLRQMAQAVAAKLRGLTHRGDELSAETAGAILISQLFVYRLLRSRRSLPTIAPDELSAPTELAQVLKAARVEETGIHLYTRDIAGQLPDQSVSTLTDVIKALDTLRPERSDLDLLVTVWETFLSPAVWEAITADQTPDKDAIISTILDSDKTNTR